MGIGCEIVGVAAGVPDSGGMVAGFWLMSRGWVLLFPIGLGQKMPTLRPLGRVPHLPTENSNSAERVLRPQQARFLRLLSMCAPPVSTASRAVAPRGLGHRVADARPSPALAGLGGVR